MSDLSALSDAGAAQLMQGALDARTAPAPDAQLNPAQANQEIGRLRKDTAWASSYLSGNSQAKSRMAQLQAWANPAEDSGAPPAADAKPLTPEEQFAAATAPNVGNDRVTDSAMARPADPGAYELPGIPAGVHTPEQTELIASTRTALHEAGFAPVIGKFVAERIDAGLKNPPNDIQRAHAQTASLSQLRQAWGPQFDSNLAAVRAEIGRISQKVPGVTEWLERSGAGNDVAVIRHLHNAISARSAT